MSEFLSKAKALYESGRTLEQVAVEMGSSRAWVSRILRRAGVEMRPTSNPWSEAEDAILRENFHNQMILIALLPGRTESAISNRRKFLGLKKHPDRVNRKWTDADYEYIQANAHMSLYALGKAIGATASSIKAAMMRGKVEKVFSCVVCSAESSSQSNYCSAHKAIGKQFRSYTSKSNVAKRPFELSNERTYELLMGDCTYCGGAGGGIDRVDSRKGYVEGNVVSCCRRCNVMKNDMTVDEFKAQIRRVAIHMGVTNG